MSQTSDSMCRWPTSSALARFGLTTPLLVIDLDRWHERVRSFAETFPRRGISWHPTLNADRRVLPLPRWHSALAEAGVDGICPTSVTTATDAPTNDISFTLLQPPVAGGGPARLAGILSEKDVAVVSDHFSQAEILAEAAARDRQVVSIDLRVDVGPDRWGASPGVELTDLAAGISRLHGVRLRGLFLPPRRGDSGIPAWRAPMRDDQYVGMVLAAVASARQAGHEPSLLSFDSHETALLVSDDLPHVPRIVRRRLPEIDGHVLCGVTARPLRDSAILDAGVMELGTTPSLGRRTSWRIESVRPAGARLRRDVGEEELTIGEAIPLQPSADARLDTLPRLVNHHGRWAITAPG